jgi:hypothetical protein
MSTDQAMQAQALFERSLLAKSNVVGVAVGFKESKGEKSGDVALVVLVEEKKPLAALSAEDVIPKEVDGMRTDVYEIGYLRAQPSPRDRYRPIIPSGVSIGHFKVTAGTLGTIVKDRATSEYFLLSNNHVLANSNDALVGDSILQPAAMDGGFEPSDVVARLERFIKLRFVDDPPEKPPSPEPEPTPGPTPDPSPGPAPSPAPSSPCDVVDVVVRLSNALAALVGSEKRVISTQAASVAGPVPTGRILAQAVPENLVDCALARPLDPNIFSDDIPGIGIVSETTQPMLGMRVRKYGRTTEYTEGNITLINATVNVAYSTATGQRTARFVGQTITEAMSAGGDSGSLIVEASGSRAVGLLFAGSSLATIFTPIDVVLNALNVTL